jgi:hypothetical protein
VYLQFEVRGGYSSCERFSNDDLLFTHVLIVNSNNILSKPVSSDAMLFPRHLASIYSAVHAAISAFQRLNFCQTDHKMIRCLGVAKAIRTKVSRSWAWRCFKKGRYRIETEATLFGALYAVGFRLSDDVVVLGFLQCSLPTKMFALHQSEFILSSKIVQITLRMYEEMISSSSMIAWSN